MHKRFIWIDVGKAIAISAVVLDHLLWIHIKEHSFMLWVHTYISVAGFMFLSGVTTSLSLAKTGTSGFMNTAFIFWRKKLPLVAYYILATIIWIGLLIPSDAWTLSLITEKLIKFNIIAPYYFLFILFQLFLLAPFLYAIISRLPSAVTKILFGILMFCVGTYAGQIPLQPYYSNPLYMILGGPHLGIFTLGMVYIPLSKQTKMYLQMLAIPVFIYCEWSVISTNGIHIVSFPSAFHTVWVISGVLILNMLVDKTRNVFYRFFTILSLVGKASLTIFIWHFPIVVWITQSERFDKLFLLFPFIAIIGMFTLLHHGFVNMISKIVHHGKTTTVSN